MSEILTGIALTRMKLGSHAEMLLIQNGYLTRIPKEKKGDRAKFNILKPLPSLEEIQAIRVKQFTATIGDLVEDAFSEFESLAGELSEWYDNLPEGFQQGDKGSAIEEAKDSLENISQPNVAEELATITALYPPDEDLTSRAKRCNDAASRLRVAADTLQEKVDALPEGTEDEHGMGDLADELNAAADEAEGVEFPGMYS